jgi:hypothetical protein
MGPYANEAGKKKFANVYAVNFCSPGLDLKDQPSTSSNSRMELMTDALSGKYSARDLMHKYPDTWLLYGKAVIEAMQLNQQVTQADMAEYVLPQLRTWQKALFDTLSAPRTQRTIIFVQGPPQMGKSAFQKHLKAVGTLKVFDCGDVPTWSNFVQMYPMPNPNVIMFNYGFGKGFTSDELNLLEELSDDILERPGPKYSGRIISVRAHIVVFCNEEPPIYLKPRRCLVFSVGIPGRSDGVYDFRNIDVLPGVPPANLPYFPF